MRGFFVFTGPAPSFFRFYFSLFMNNFIPHGKRIVLGGMKLT